MLHAKLKATPGWWVFFLFPPSQMTEQRKNKQRLGFLGPPQPNHHIPAHWRRTGGAHGSDGTQWRATRLQAHSKIETTQTQALRTIHAFRVHLQLLMSKKTKNARRLHIIFDSAPFSYDTVTAWRDTNRALCAHSATSGRGGGGTRLCEWSASHDTHPAVWCKRAWQGSRGNVKVNG